MLHSAHIPVHQVPVQQTRPFHKSSVPQVRDKDAGLDLLPI